MALEVVVLAAGTGTRMRSRLPKVLHPLAGRPLLAHVLDTAASLEPHRIHVVIGEHGEKVKACLGARRDISWIVQEPRHGTGHAVAQALPLIPDYATALVLLGDMPMIAKETLVECARNGKRGIAAGHCGTAGSQWFWDASCATPRAASRASSRSATHRTPSRPSSKSTPARWPPRASDWRNCLPR